MQKDKENAGLVHIYCGSGKGKTTAGMGLCARAAGHGMKVLICQFLKDGSSGECAVLRLSRHVTFAESMPRVKFSFRMSPEEKEAARTFYNNLLKNVMHRADAESFDVLFLDEVLYAVRAGLVEEEALVQFLKAKPRGLEVILTGQDPGEEVLDLADYVSVIQKYRHPYDQGVPARLGIEK